MEWQEQRLAVERLPCSEIEQFSLGKIWKENRVIQSSISSGTASQLYAKNHLLKWVIRDEILEETEPCSFSFNGWFSSL
jgi:hypothetical protein